MTYAAPVLVYAMQPEENLNKSNSSSDTDLSKPRNAILDPVNGSLQQ